ncbi:flagellar biosynthesis protein FlhF [Clostridium sp. BJN0013]|mgnify:CR=1 FL=1|uniref:flagellar biosynthesis protein FlhF n=1 Tax=Clostridium sp. BJN0013 TaxID=3236840 RepID=UPI0034C5F06E
MIIKRYKANNMNEAITRIRYELGNEAIIISQRKIRKSGIMGFFSKKILEVTAAVDNKKEEHKKSQYNNDNMKQSVEAIKKIIDNKMKDTSSDDKALSDNGIKDSGISRSFYENSIIDKNNDAVIKEVQQMKSMLNEVIQGSYGNIGKSKLQIKLENSDFSRSVVKKILNSVNAMDDDREDEEKLREVVKDMIKVDNKELEHVVVLVGPTGVGKTTTIAKLAGKLVLIEKKKVGLITIDTYRIGAVEQLRTYADIMNIPFQVILSMKDMSKAIDNMKSCDTILIDTTGRSSRNEMQISELRAFIDKVQTNNVHLVISCTTKDKDIDVIVNGYKKLNYSDIIITKLDETSTYGSILNILQSAKKPISFVTTGQNVPEDIKIMEPEELAKLVLGEDIIC